MIFLCNFYPLTKIGDWEMSCCIVSSLWLSLRSCVRTALSLLRNSSCHKCGWAGWHLKLGFITAKGKIGFNSHWQAHDGCCPRSWPGIMKEWKTIFFCISKSITDAIEVMMGSGSHFVVKCLSLPGIELPLAMEISQQPAKEILSGFVCRQVCFP